ncbi:MAG: terpene cyclase/mutase family protein, partial [Pirellulaceae bacterium]|nr:terpene cyclase/mutase family protein [Pirellulaceae bacterium]
MSRVLERALNKAKEKQLKKEQKQGRIQRRKKNGKNAPGEIIKKQSPPWVTSLIVHTLFLVILALISLPQLVQPIAEIELDTIEDFGEQLEREQFELSEDPQTDFSDISELADEVLSIDANRVAVDLALTGQSNLAAAVPNIGRALSGREKGMKKVLLAVYGGTQETEKAVEMGLQWLKKQQRHDGTWSLTGPYANGSFRENQTAATAMAMLAFLGAGHTHQSGLYKKEVNKGLHALLKMQKQNGDFYTGRNRSHHYYSHAQAAIAICELYGMTNDSQLREPAQRAIDFSVKIQSSQGGWRYNDGVDDADTSVTGWFVMVYQSALMAGLEVPQNSIDKISKFLDSVQAEETGDYYEGALYKYTRFGRTFATHPMTAEALLCRQYLGWGQNDTRLIQGAEYLLSYPISKSAKDRPDVYYWYYATQVMHHLGGKAWDEWNEDMRTFLPNTQVTKGKEKGSWYNANDAWGSRTGRLYTTCLSLYNLEVYYRHLPIYEKVQAPSSLE